MTLMTGSDQCGVCRHKQAVAITIALALKQPKIGAVAKRYGLSMDSLRRHRSNHMPPDVVERLLLLATTKDDEPITTRARVDLSDPIALAKACDLELDDWQRELLTNTPRRCLLLASRQSGKSTIASLAALHRALNNPKSLVLIVSPSQRQSALMMRTILQFHEQIAAPKLQNENMMSAAFSNGSQIVALPGEAKTVRGYSKCNLCIIDEASRVPDDLMVAIRPTLAVSNGTLLAITTPNTKSGWFYKSWISNEDWHRVRVPASECPRISPEFLQEELQSLGQAKFECEYNLNFNDPLAAVFSTTLIDAAFAKTELKPLWH